MIQTSSHRTAKNQESAQQKSPQTENTVAPATMEEQNVTEINNTEAEKISSTPTAITEHQKKRKRKSLRKSAHKSWKDWIVRLGTSARVLSFLALLMIFSMWSESIEYSKSNNLLQGSIASIDINPEEIQTVEENNQTDIQASFGVEGSDLLEISFTKNPRGLQKMEISIVYDASASTLGEALTTLPGCQSNTQEVISGLAKVQLECNKSLDIAPGKKVLSLPIAKQKKDKTSVINMVEASFTTKDQTTYKLSTPSITH